MNRLMLALNVCLALFLGYRIATTGNEAAAHGRTTAAWTAADVVERTRVYGGRPGWLSEIVLDLGADVTDGAGSEPIDLGLRLEPEFPMTAYAGGPRSAVLVFHGGLPPARAYTIHASRALTSLDGAELPAGVLFAFETPAVKLGSVRVDEDRDTGRLSLLAWFDQPVDLAAVRAHLSVRDAESGAEVPVTVASQRWGDEEMFRIAAASGDLPDRSELSVLDGLRPRGGSIGTRGVQRSEIVLREPLLVTGASLEDGGIELSFNRAIGLPESDCIALEPAIPFQVFQNRSGLRLVGAFPPGAVLGVTLREGFPGHGRHTLRTDERRSLLVPDRSAELEFARRGSVLSAHAEPTLEVRTINVDSFHVRAARVYPNNVVRLLQAGASHATAPAVVREVVVHAARNDEAVERIDLRELLGVEQPRGLYQFEIWSDERRWRRARRLVQLTDLGVTLRAASDAAAVQVVSIAGGEAIAGAGVEIVSPTNQVLATATTDARGVALVRWAGPAQDRTAFLVHVRAGEDEAFVDLDGCAVELADPTLGGRPYAGELPEAYVWPTRGIVRPGERIEATVILRDAAAKAVAGRDIVVAFVQPNGRTSARVTRATPGSGLVTATFDTSVDAPVGTWQVRALDREDGDQLGAAAVQVEAFVPYRLEAAVAALEPLRFGGTCAVRVTGRWLDGAPAAGREVSLRVRLSPGSFELDPPEGFAFTGGADDPPPGELREVRGVLDANGTAELRLQLPAEVRRQALVAHLLAEVVDPSGRVVRASAREPVLRPDFQLGVRATSAGVELRAVTAGGEPAPGVTIATVRLERRLHRWGYHDLRGGRWRWVTRVEKQVIGEWPVQLQGGAAALEIEFPRQRSGGWLAVVATAGDVTTEQAIGDVPANPDRLRVEAAADPVSPGGAARVTVDAPAAGRGFVTLEGPSIVAIDVVELQRGRNELVVPVPGDVRVPNLHVVVTLTRAARLTGPDLGPAWLVGGAALPLRRDDVGGTVSLNAPASVLPGADLECAVSAPGASSAVVAVVDEGVLAITRHRGPDPIGHFLAQRRLAVRGADAFAALMEGAEYVAGTKTGGDGDDLGSLLAVGSISPRIRPLALFAEVPLDVSGHGIARFTLPPYEGRVRVMALAAGPTALAGAVHETVVKAPLGLLATAPRMVAPGDRFVVPVTLRNETGADGEVTLRASASGGLQLVDSPARRARLRNGEVATFDVAVRALGEVAEAAPALELEAVLGDARRIVTAVVEVRELRLLRDEHFGVRLGDAQELRIPETYAPERLRAFLHVDATPDVHLRPALEALVEYPYGCVEQTTSRGFALLACQALLPRIYGGGEVPFDASALVQAAVDRLVGMQDAHGSFGWWAGARNAYPFGTVYAMDFLLTAHDYGYRVPESAMRGGLERVHDIAVGDGTVAVRSIACELVSRSGNPSRGLVEWLATQTVHAEERAMLAIAFARLDERQRAADLMRVEPDVGAGREQGRSLRSSLRTRALWFRARFALDPGDARLPELAWGMQREILQTGRRTTQEMGQVLRALAEYYRVRSPGAFATVRGTIDGVPLPAASAGRIELDVRPGSVLALDAGGTGFALLTIHGMRPPEPASGDGSLQLRRVIVDPATGEAVTQFQRGRVYEVRLEGVAHRGIENLVIADPLPGGFEAEAPPPGAAPVRGRRRDHLAVDARIERRDDRVLLFHAARLAGRFRFSHLVRATVPGSYAAWPPVAEAMYDPGARFTGSAPDGVEILP